MNDARPQKQQKKADVGDSDVASKIADPFESNRSGAAAVGKKALGARQVAASKPKVSLKTTKKKPSVSVKEDGQCPRTRSRERPYVGGMVPHSTRTRTHIDIRYPCGAHAPARGHATDRE